MRPRPPGDTWKCFARPASKGATCGYINVGGGEMYHIGECCRDCGCTRKASNDREGCQ